MMTVIIRMVKRRKRMKVIYKYDFLNITRSVILSVLSNFANILCLNFVENYRFNPNNTVYIIF